MANKAAYQKAGKIDKGTEIDVNGRGRSMLGVSVRASPSTGRPECNISSSDSWAEAIAEQLPQPLCLRASCYHSRIIHLVVNHQPRNHNTTCLTLPTPPRQSTTLGVVSVSVCRHTSSLLTATIIKTLQTIHCFYPRQPDAHSGLATRA